MAINNTISGMFSPSRLSSSAFGLKTTTPTSTYKPPVQGVVAPQAPVSQSNFSQSYTPPATSDQLTGTSYTPPPATSSSSLVPPPAQNTSTTTPTTSTTPPISFKGLVSTLAGTASAGSPRARNYTQQTADYGAQNAATGQQAVDIAKQFGQKYADIGGLGARFEAGQLTTGTSPVAQGNAAVTAQTTAAQQQALAEGEQAALQGIGYEQAGFTNASNASNAAAGQEYTGQGQTLSGLNNAANLAQPNTAAYGQTVFDPLTGQYTGGGSNLDPQTQASSLAQKVMDGSMTYDQALASIGYAGSAGTNFLNQAITGAGGNPLQLQASGAATQNVIGTQTQQVEGYKSALQQGQNLQSQLTDLIGTFGLNPNDVNAVNAGLAKIAQNVSSPQYKILSNYVNDIANTYAQVLTPPGGSATDTTRSLATSMLDATAKGASLIATMKSLDQAAQAKIAGVPTTGGSAGGSSNNSSGGLFSW
jgi:hypothetical protein